MDKKVENVVFKLHFQSGEEETYKINRTRVNSFRKAFQEEKRKRYRDKWIDFSKVERMEKEKELEPEWLDE